MVFVRAKVLAFIILLIYTKRWKFLRGMSAEDHHNHEPVLGWMKVEAVDKTLQFIVNVYKNTPSRTHLASH